MNELLQIDQPGVVLSGTRDAITQMLDSVLDNQHKHKLPVIGFTITMPCGYERDFSSHDDIPQDDIPCPCGVGFLMRIE